MRTKYETSPTQQNEHRRSIMRIDVANPLEEQSCVRVYLSADLDLITTITPSQIFTNQNQRLTLETWGRYEKNNKNNKINENVWISLPRIN